MEIAFVLFSGSLTFCLIKSLFDWQQEIDQKYRLANIFHSHQFAEQRISLLFKRYGPAVLGGAAGIFLFPEEAIVFSFLGVLVGFGGQLIWKSHLKRKQRSARYKQMPIFLSLFSMSLSSGQTFEQAWEMSTEFLPEGALKAAMRQSLHDIDALRSRETVIKNLVTRLDDTRLSPVWSLILQSVRQGAPIHNLLLEQAEFIRQNYLLSVEQRGQTAPIRLLFPILLFIFPSIFIVIFGPLYVYFLQGGFF